MELWYTDEHTGDVRFSIKAEQLVVTKQSAVQRIDIPLQDIVSFGRLDIIEGMPANDVVLTLPDEVATRQISRWHFELRRRPGGYTLRSVSTNPTVVDGRVLQRGDEAPALPGSVIMLSGVMTLDLLGPPGPDDASGDATMVVA